MRKHHNEMQGDRSEVKTPREKPSSAIEGGIRVVRWYRDLHFPSLAGFFASGLIQKCLNALGQVTFLPLDSGTVTG